MIGFGVALALATSVSWAIGNVLVQRLGKVVEFSRAMLWSMMTGALLAAPCAVLLDERSAPFTASCALWAVIAALAGVLAYSGLFFAFANERLTVAVPLVSSWPLVAAGISVALLGERLRSAQWFGAAIVIAGAVLVTLPRRGAATALASRWTLPAAFAAALGFGVMMPAMGRIAPALGAFGTTTVVFVLGIVLAAGLGAAFGMPLRPPPRSVWKLVFAAGLVETAGFVCMTGARHFAPMAIVAPVASLASVLTVLYAWAVLGERPRALVVVGALLSGIGVVVLAT